MRVPHSSPPLLSPSSSPPHPRRRLIACLALLASQLAHAQGQGPAVASDPEAATAPLIHQSLAAPMPLAALPSPQAWREAHEAVAAFPRGHTDLVAWEARHGATQPNAAPPGATPAAATGHASMPKPAPAVHGAHPGPAGPSGPHRGRPHPHGGTP